MEKKRRARKRQDRDFVVWSVLALLGIVVLVALAAQYGGLSSRLGARVSSSPEPMSSDVPPCPWTDPNNPPEWLPPKPSPEEGDDDDQCRAAYGADCTGRIDGKLWRFSAGGRACEPSQEIGGEECSFKKGTVVKGAKVCRLTLDQKTSRWDCRLDDYDYSKDSEDVDLDVTCSIGSEPRECPPVKEEWLNPSACRTCWEWAVEEDNGKGLACEAVDFEWSQEVVQCEYAPAESDLPGQDGWRIDRYGCYESGGGGASPGPECLGSCQVIFLDSNNNCEPRYLEPGQCVIPNPQVSGPPYFRG